MSNEVARNPFDIGISIVLSTAEDLATWSKPPFLPSLGPDYTHLLEKVEAMRRAHLDEIVKWHRSRSENDLITMFNKYGQALTPEAIIWQNQKRQRVIEFVQSLLPEIAAGLGAPNLMADYDHWSKAAYYRVSEVLWLSFGLEPRATFAGRELDPTQQSTVRSWTYSVVNRRRDLIQREFDPGASKRTIDPLTLVAWVQSTGLEVHEGFAGMLAEIGSRSAKANNTKISPAGPPLKLEIRKFDDREKQSLATLIVAMAIDGYGYDPSALRSPFPKDMQNIMASLGLHISQDTIRKYLKLGAGYLPDGWKPETG